MQEIASDGNNGSIGKEGLKLWNIQYSWQNRRSWYNLRTNMVVGFTMIIPVKPIFISFSLWIGKVASTAENAIILEVSPKFFAS